MIGEKTIEIIILHYTSEAKPISSALYEVCKTWGQSPILKIKIFLYFSFWIKKICH